jgi:hypothetical protein
MTGGQPPSNAMVALNQLTMASGAGGPQGAATVKRRKKSTAQPNPKKMFEEVLERFCYTLCIVFFKCDPTRSHVLVGHFGCDVMYW